MGSEEHTCLQRLGLDQDCPFVNIFAIPSLQDGGSFDYNKMIEVNKDLLWKMLSRVFDPDRGPPERWTVTNKGDPNKFYIVFHWCLDRAGYVASNNDGVTTLSWIEDFWDPTAPEFEAQPAILENMRCRRP